MLPTEGWIDVHAHYTPPDFMELAARKLGQEVSVQQTRDGEVLTRPGQEQRTYQKGELSGSESLEQRIADMDATGAAVQVISPGGTFSFYEQPVDIADYLSAQMNDRLIAAVDEYPDRLMAMVTLPLQDAAASIRELDRVRQHPGVRAIRIGSSIDEIELDDPRLFPFYEAAEAADIPLFIHPYIYAIAGSERMKQFNLSNLVGYPATTTLGAARLIFGGVLERFPRLRFCLAHAGGYLAIASPRLARGFMTRPDTRVILQESPEILVRRFYVDTIAHSATLLDYVRSVFGDDRLVCGTDYPFQIGDADPRRNIGKMAAPDSAKRAALRENALRYLGIAEGASVQAVGQTA
jgi:aminocarboxymuconate-semialdehyde decarboxylase